MSETIGVKEDIQDITIGSHKLFGITHIGLCRKSNEDRYMIKELTDKVVLISVADGLGDGVTGGFAAEMIRKKLFSITNISRDHEQPELVRIVSEIDRAIYAEGLKDKSLEGMGSTMVGVLVREATAYWVHVGDSRLYLLRNKVLTQVTEDQTLARFLLKEDQITPEQITTHYSRQVMDQYLGCGHVEPETGRLNIYPKDLLVLTTDGLHKQIPTDILISILNAPSDLATKGRSLVKAALGAGGSDNITVVMAGGR